MKKIFVIIFPVIFFVFSVNAQIKRETNATQNIAANSDKKKDKIEMMKSLNLSKAQMGQLKESRRSIKEKKNAVTNDKMLTEEQKQSKLKDLHKEQKEKLNSILTPEQMEKFKTERKNAKIQKNHMTKSDSTSSTLDN